MNSTSASSAQAGSPACLPAETGKEVVAARENQGVGVLILKGIDQGRKVLRCLGRQQAGFAVREVKELQLVAIG